jgi:hypothetical protein
MSLDSTKFPVQWVPEAIPAGIKRVKREADHLCLVLRVRVHGTVAQFLRTPLWQEQQDRQCTYNITLRRVRGTMVAVESNKQYKFVCVCGCPGAWACACACVHVTLLIQHASRMRHIVTSFVAPQAPPHFSTLSHKRRDFRKTGC